MIVEGDMYIKKNIKNMLDLLVLNSFYIRLLQEHSL